MNYKLINKQTGTETICSKVILDGFDYYVSGDFKVGDKVKLKSDINVGQVIDDINKDWSNYWFNPIATNNSNIDIPKVVDEVERLGEDETNIRILKHKTPSQIARQYFDGFIEGYNKSQETHPFSEEDMIEFAKFSIKNNFCKEENRYCQYWELLQLWKEQKPKTIWYE